MSQHRKDSVVVYGILEWFYYSSAAVGRQLRNAGSKHGHYCEFDR